ncbi:hypothetical protein Q9233_015505 [Columba guinea]|nr:hypothetical protein Q9233_015505 [Columba guinea]
MRGLDAGAGWGALALGLLLVLLCPPPSPAETYTAMASVRRALGSEGRLLRRLRGYLREERGRLRRLARFYEKVQALHQDPEASVDNPLLAFSLIKRLHSDWPNVIYSDEATENTQEDGEELIMVTAPQSSLIPLHAPHYPIWGCTR